MPDTRDPAPRPRLATVDLLGVPVVNCTTRAFIDYLLTCAQASCERPAFVSYLNAACSNIAARDRRYADILRKADAVYADGMAIVWASRLLGTPLPERVNAADFVLEFCREIAAAGLSLYLLGSEENVATRAAERFQREVPDLKIAGAASGYFPDRGETVLADIARLKPDILLVGMGVPLQEKWVDANPERISARLVWCVGAMFEYYGEARARAPVWMRRAGLEWAFRLVLEPRRLWRRYLVGNVVFAWRVLKARIKG